MERLEPVVDVENLTSQRVTEKVGFLRECSKGSVFFFLFIGKKVEMWSCIVFFFLIFLKIDHIKS